MSSPKMSLNELQKKRKTRFPLSRIKKIMHQNEEVGKAAVTVPVVLSKALELFFEQIVVKLAANADKRGSKKIQALDFREIVEASGDLYSFLMPLCVEKVEEEQ